MSKKPGDDSKTGINKDLTHLNSLESDSDDDSSPHLEPISLGPPPEIEAGPKPPEALGEFSKGELSSLIDLTALRASARAEEEAAGGAAPPAAENPHTVEEANIATIALEPIAPVEPAEPAPLEPESVPAIEPDLQPDPSFQLQPSAEPEPETAPEEPIIPEFLPEEEANASPEPASIFESSHTFEAAVDSVPAHPPKTGAVPDADSATLTSFTQVRDYAQRLPLGTPAVAASFPFSVMIDGKLKPEEQEKLTDIILDHPMGITDEDLKIQFAGHRVLIPRVSEYAAVMIAQALRATTAKLRLGPSDDIYNADKDSSGTPLVTPPPAKSETWSIAPADLRNEAPGNHPADRMPVSAGGSLPGGRRVTVIDTLTTSAILRAQVLESPSSPQYIDMLESLKRELKYRAYRKGATAILHFTLKISSLILPSHYRVTALGTAVKEHKQPTTGTPGLDTTEIDLITP